jgi:hypothetical protein
MEDIELIMDTRDNQVDTAAFCDGIRQASNTAPPQRRRDSYALVIIFLSLTMFKA